MFATDEQNKFYSKWCIKLYFNISHDHDIHLRKCDVHMN